MNHSSKNNIEDASSALKLASQLAKTDTADQLFDIVHNTIKNINTDIEFSSIFSSNNKDIAAFNVASHSFKQVTAEENDFFLNDKLADLLVKSASLSEPILFEPIDYYDEFLFPADTVHKTVTCLTLPFNAPSANQHLILVIAFVSSKHPHVSSLNTMIDFLSLIGVTLDNVYKLQRLKEHATFDHLTGLLNRRAISEILEREHGRATRHQRRYSVLFLDIDNFKTINDIYGHNIGDQALKEIAINASDVLREGDWIGRWGGEEFICILPDTTIKGAENIAKRLCDKITNSHLITKNHRIPLTVSIGIACYPVDGTYIDDLLEHADTGLLDAKSSGKNCVKRAHTQPPRNSI